MKRTIAAISVCFFLLTLCACRGTAGEKDLLVEETPEAVNGIGSSTEKPEAALTPEPSPVLTSQPSPELAPAPAPEATPETLVAPQREELENYFENTVFIGDSIMVKV